MPMSKSTHRFRILPHLRIHPVAQVRIDTNWNQFYLHRPLFIYFTIPKIESFQQVKLYQESTTVLLASGVMDDKVTLCLRQSPRQKYTMGTLLWCTDGWQKDVEIIQTYSSTWNTVSQSSLMTFYSPRSNCEGTCKQPSVTHAIPQQQRKIGTLQ